ncbi:MAG: 7-carboxy-7-deazaguanine synthase [Candidatus Ozemobacteraceae bacterium]
MYRIKELFYSLQGEGAQSGRPAVFCRFSGCNLWNGLEEGRGEAVCRFCDTNFSGTDGKGGGIYPDPRKLAHVAVGIWPVQLLRQSWARPFIVLTGGEPLLQVDDPLLAELHSAGFEIAVETNGTRQVPKEIDWISVSPKAGTELVQRRGNELKLVFPQEGVDPASFLGLPFDHFYLQPLDDSRREDNTKKTVSYCLENPRWRISVQLHKYLGIA